MPKVKASNKTFWTPETKKDTHPASFYLRKITNLCVELCNDDLKYGSFFRHKINIKTQFASDSQTTQTVTKMLQYLVNLNLVIAAKRLGIKLVDLSEDGFDYELTVEIDGQLITWQIEFKLIADSESTQTYFATGNKISALKDENGNSVGKKVPLLWTIKYHLSDDGLIDDYGAFFMDGDTVKNKLSGWFASASSRVSLSQYILRKTDLDAVDVLHGRLYYTTGMDKIYNLCTTFGPYKKESKKKSTAKLILTDA